VQNYWDSITTRKEAEKEYIWGVVFEKEVDFEGTKFFKEANFSLARFSEDVSFAGAEFCDNTIFSTAQFSEEANFRNVRFSREVHFEARFSGGADFSQGQFAGEAIFRRARFSKPAGFYETQFLGNVDFAWVQFSGGADFREAQFYGEADFHEAQFSEDVYFYETQFLREADFCYAQFSGSSANFYKAQFSGDAFFTRAQFLAEAYFHNAQFSGDVDFTETQFSKDGVFVENRFSGRAIFREALFNRLANFQESRFEKLVSFANVRFDEQANFAAVEFKGVVLFPGVQFKGLSSKAPPVLFWQSARFDNAIFYATAVFRKTQFKHATFSGDGAAIFLAKADFRDCQFETVDFGEVFFEDADFTGATFTTTLAITDTIYNSMKIDWEKVAHVIEPRDDPEVFRSLEDNFKGLKRLDYANGAYYQRKIAERQSKPLPERYLEMVFVDWTCGYGVRWLNVIIVSVILVLLFSFFYFPSGVIERLPQEEELLAPRLTGIPLKYLPREPKEEQVEASVSSSGRFWRAMSFSSAVFTKIGFGGKYVTAESWVVTVAKIEWILGLAVGSLLLYTLSNTVPILHTLLTEVF